MSEQNDIIAEAIAKQAQMQAEKEKKEQAAAAFQKKQDERYKHNTKRAREEKENPEKIYWSLYMTGNGVNVRFSGLFGLSMVVPKDPEYLSVDNVIDRLVFCEEFGNVNRHSFDINNPIYILQANTIAGDKARAEVFEAYKCAFKVYAWCKENKCEIFEFGKKFNPEFMTTYDYEVKEFFKEKKKDE